ncbi:MAG TPA: hypothetical protein PLG73_02950 [Candidatus Sumerlaeota bacterium]|nr:hypothetical protein [Candidatus Sumerlaeota bacterium]
MLDALVLCFSFHWPACATAAAHAALVDRALAPLLACAARRPRLPLTLHLTGPLLEHLAQSSPDLLEELAGLVARSQVEPLGGPWAPCLLPLLDPASQDDQLAALADACHARLDARPAGALPTGWVWDHETAARLARHGYAYALLPEARLRAARPEPPAAGLPAVTTQGGPLRLLPVAAVLPGDADAAQIEQGLRALAAARAAGFGAAALTWLFTPERPPRDLNAALAPVIRLTDAAREAPFALAGTAVARAAAGDEIHLPDTRYSELCRHWPGADSQPAAPWMDLASWRAGLLRDPANRAWQAGCRAVSAQLAAAAPGAPELGRARRLLRVAQSAEALQVGQPPGRATAATRHALAAARNALARIHHGDAPWVASSQEADPAVLLESDRWVLAADPAGGGLRHLHYRPRDLSLLGDWGFPGDVVFGADRFLPRDASAADPESVRAAAAGAGPLQHRLLASPRALRLGLHREFELELEGRSGALSLRKSVILERGEDEFTLECVLKNTAAAVLPLAWAIELNLRAGAIGALWVHAPDAPAPAAGAVLTHLLQFGFDDPRRNLRIRFSFSWPCELTLPPAEPAAEGLLTLFPIWRLELEPGIPRPIAVTVDARPLF